MAHKVKVYSKSELAEMYGVTRITLMKWVKPVMEEHNFNRSKRCNYFTPKEVELIFKHLGYPY